MTSPYITFEEMEEGVPHSARLKTNGRLFPHIFRKSGDRLEMLTFAGDWVKYIRDKYALYAPIPVYSPPNSWDEYVDDAGDFKYKIKEADFYINCELIDGGKAAIDWLQDELDRRKKAGES